MKRDVEGNNIIKSNIVALIMTVFSNLLGVIFQLLSGRLIKDHMVFSDLNAVLSLNTILTFPLGIVSYMVAKVIAELQFYKKEDMIADVFNKFFKLSVMAALVVSSVVFVFSDVIADFFNVGQSIYIMLTAALAGITICEASFLGIFQGLKNFFWYNLVTILMQMLKVFAICVSGVNDNQLVIILLVLCIGIFGVIIVAWMKVHKIFRRYNSVRCDIDLMETCKFGVVMFWANTINIIQNNMDMLLVKHYLNELSSQYSMALIWVKTITYFSGAIAAVLFPFTISMKTSRKKLNRMLFSSLLINIVLEVGMLVVLLMGGRQGILYLYGNSYLKAYEYIFPLGIMLLPSGLNIVMANMALGLCCYKELCCILGISILCEILFTFCLHASIEQIIYVIAVVFWGTFILLLASLMKRINELE